MATPNSGRIVNLIQSQQRLNFVASVLNVVVRVPGIINGSIEGCRLKCTEWSDFMFEKQYRGKPFRGTYRSYFHCKYSTVSTTACPGGTPCFSSA